jgi:hypothetical protein
MTSFSKLFAGEKVVSRSTRKMFHELWWNFVQFYYQKRGKTTAGQEKTMKCERGVFSLYG